MIKPEILLVDDEPALLRAAARVLTFAGIGPLLECTDGHAALSHLAARPVGVMVIDLSMPGMSGQELLAHVKADFPDVQVIVMTGSSELRVAVECMQQGAIDYLVKPVPEARLCSAVRRALELYLRHEELRAMCASMQRPGTGIRQRFPEIVTQDQQMMGILRYLEAIAPSPSTVLVTGETGTGKELVAQALHRLSGRPGKLVVVNIGALDDATFSDTLFGHARGAFAGSTGTRAGLVQAADEGTLFLDEIGELEPHSQLKLLRLLDDGSYAQCGSDLPRRCHARIVVATNRDVEQEVALGRMRRDLYFRLRVHAVRLPPLRERMGDLPMLVPHLLARAAAEQQKRVPTEPEALYQLLHSYHFPGNLRELRDMCRDAVAQHNGRVLSMRSFREHIERGPAEGRPTPSVTAINSGSDDSWLPHPLPHMTALEEAAVREALSRAKGNQGAAARLLGMSRAALNRRVVEMRRRKPETALPAQTVAALRLASARLDKLNRSRDEPTLRERYLGTLLGLACGDAVGTTVEFSPRGSFTPLTGMQGGGPFNLKRGQWTDDTSMALCLAESLLERGTFDARDQMGRYLDWWQNGHLSSTGECFDIGKTTREALSRFASTGEPYAGSAHPRTAGNGSLMRLAPIALLFHPDMDLTLRYAAESSRTTHGAPEAVDCCRLLAFSISRALSGAARDQLLLGGGRHVTEPAVVAMAEGKYVAKQREAISGSGYSVASLEAALWCIAHSTTLEEAILTAVNLGDDADTTGAITGQIAGALYGCRAIPEKWLASLHMRDEISNLASRLYEVACAQR
jgi:DNA-binding NtrC family response regulator/ADP-ribosylglycohydrolase